MRRRAGRLFWGKGVRLVGLAGLAMLAGLPAWAGVIDCREINALTNSLMINNELLYLELVEEQGDDTTVMWWGSAITQSGWTTTLSGSLLGQPVQVSYTGLYTPTSEYTGTITYSSTGNWGSQQWLGSGTLYWEEYRNGASGGLSSGMIGVQVGVSARLGIVSLGVNVDKDALRKQLTADAYVGLIDIPLLGSAWNTGGRFKLDQATGVDQCYIYTEVLWGLYTKERAIGDKTRLFRRDPPPPIQPPGDPARLPIQPPYPRTEPPWESPPMPPGSTPGTEGMSPGDTVYDYGYVGGYWSYPEPATLWLLAVSAVLLRRRG